MPDDFVQHWLGLPEQELQALQQAEIHHQYQREG